MKFVMTKTSHWLDGPPCDGCLENIETGPKGNTWNTWTREFNTLEELVQFANEQGDLVITSGNDIFGNTLKDIAGRIEIYNDYRE